MMRGNGSMASINTNKTMKDQEEIDEENEQ